VRRCIRSAPLESFREAKGCCEAKGCAYVDRFAELRTDRFSIAREGAMTGREDP